MNINPILQKALQYCEPSLAEVKRISGIANEARDLVSSYRSSKIIEVTFGGSFAKGTWLKGDTDIDIFVRIDESVDNEEFERLGKQIGIESLKRYRPYLRYSDHPYVEAFVKGIRINVVPCYNVKVGNWKSAADRSPFHTEYVKHNLNNEMIRHVRLLKRMLKSISVYGAEIARNGFSGYAIEVLILKYGSLPSLLQVISDIKKEGNVFSINSVDEDVIKTFASPLVIIDPIDPRRNLGTAISTESVGKFVLVARRFLQKPSLNYFIKRERYARPYEEIYPNLLVIEFGHTSRSPDIIWGQLKRSLDALSKQLELAGFIVIRSTCITDEKRSAAFIFLLESIFLSLYIEKIGPEVFRKKETANFISKNRKISNLIWINRQMRVSALVKRNLINAKDFIKMLVSKKIENTGISSGLKEDIQQTLCVYTANEFRLKGIIKEAINELTTTERLAF
ncbi:MAG TPA: CCA tRNA nucleotidyltransferase [Nitrososphaeraceae archaeon]|nr:CCA tRNA nucleotidyltransferase [Nitrososphaeraceae archaeon]